MGWDGCALLVRPSKMHHSIWKITFLGGWRLVTIRGDDEYLERLGGKIRKCLFFYVKIFLNNSVLLPYLLFLHLGAIVIKMGFQAPYYFLFSTNTSQTMGDKRKKLGQIRVSVPHKSHDYLKELDLISVMWDLIPFLENKTTSNSTTTYSRLARRISTKRNKMIPKGV